MEKCSSSSNVIVLMDLIQKPSRILDPNLQCSLVEIESELKATDLKSRRGGSLVRAESRKLEPLFYSENNKIHQQQKRKRNVLQGPRQRKFTRERFGGLLEMFEGYLGKSFPCKNTNKNALKKTKM